jgi:hypothetical protein
MPQSSTPFFQFTLRQLMAAAVTVCLLASVIYWLGLGLGLFAIVSIGSIICTIWLLSRRQVGLAIFVILMGLMLTCLLLPAIQRVGTPYSIGRCQNNLHNLALALQQYETDNGCFPPAYIADADGKPIHSWRVLLLPYLEERILYREYRFDEPWDGPNNSALAAKVDRVFCYDCPRSNNSGETSYVAVIGPQTMWPGAKSTKMSDIKDGTPNTIMLVEVHNSGIHWMEPRDLDLSQMDMAINSPNGPSISSGHIGGWAHVVFVSGQTRAIDNNAPPKAIRAALTIAGGEKDVLPASRIPK